MSTSGGEVRCVESDVTNGGGEGLGVGSGVGCCKGDGDMEASWVRWESVDVHVHDGNGEAPLWVATRDAHRSTRTAPGQESGHTHTAILQESSYTVVYIVAVGRSRDKLLSTQASELDTCKSQLLKYNTECMT